MDSKFKVGDVLKFEDGLMGIVASVYPPALTGYNDLVLRVKVGADQVKRMKIGEDTIEFETADKNIRELQKENESLKKEIEAMKEALDRQKHDNDVWRQGWFDCLKSVGYYLNS